MFIAQSQAIHSFKVSLICRFFRPLKGFLIIVTRAKLIQRTADLSKQLCHLSLRSSITGFCYFQVLGSLTIHLVRGRSVFVAVISGFFHPFCRFCKVSSHSTSFCVIQPYGELRDRIIGPSKLFPPISRFLKILLNAITVKIGLGKVFHAVRVAVFRLFNLVFKRHTGHHHVGHHFIHIGTHHLLPKEEHIAREIGAVLSANNSCLCIFSLPCRFENNASSTVSKLFQLVQFSGRSQELPHLQESEHIKRNCFVFSLQICAIKLNGAIRVYLPCF